MTSPLPACPLPAPLPLLTLHPSTTARPSTAVSCAMTGQTWAISASPAGPPPDRHGAEVLGVRRVQERLRVLPHRPRKVPESSFLDPSCRLNLCPTFWLRYCYCYCYSCYCYCYCSGCCSSYGSCSCSCSCYCYCYATAPAAATASAPASATDFFSASAAAMAATASVKLLALLLIMIYCTRATCSRVASTSSRIHALLLTRTHSHALCISESLHVLAGCPPVNC